MGRRNQNRRHHCNIRYATPRTSLSCKAGSDKQKAAIGGGYEFARVAAANLREKDDAWNPTIGGFVGGSIVGLRCPQRPFRSVPPDPVADRHADRSFPAVLGFGALLAIIQGTFDYTGGKMTGFARDGEVDEYERTEQVRRNKRRPIEETLQELGEGRGMLKYW